MSSCSRPRSERRLPFSAMAIMITVPLNGSYTIGPAAGGCAGVAWRVQVLPSNVHVVESGPPEPSMPPNATN